MTPDIINGCFELLGAVFTWMNAWRLYQDRRLQGVYWPTCFFFTFWGLWNLYYYPTLDQWFSFYAGVLMVSGNVAWVVLLARYYLWPTRQVIGRPING
ncbi:hypothetical protein [Pseudomaricurvus sp. HS19]|uniref:hypothetical protein n=1 Tax=Pseudomaricurvus sp. HS19 TaxID=2692626 RepID=UPI00136DE4BC|nr:hypothetical protein [Pseudomaricurvus sp. HS19]MYM62354.1 hypothetical protein [Pseudomaricurvus sp. HS19]